jgi:two-component system chemotaxis response regulator CheY
MIKRILIVDDSGISRKVTRKCLEFAGFSSAEFIEAENGEVALAALESGTIDLMVTDLNMPVMDGFELLRALDDVVKAKHLIKIVTSSAASETTEADLRTHGVLAVFSKPMNPTAVAKALASLGGKRP